jgi:hypothetical protein
MEYDDYIFDGGRSIVRFDACGFMRPERQPRAKLLVSRRIAPS